MCNGLIANKRRVHALKNLLNINTQEISYSHHLAGVLLWQWYDPVCPRQLVYKETQWIQCYTHTLRDFLLSSSGWSPPLAVVRPCLPSPTSVQGDTVNTMLHTHTHSEISYTHHLTGVLLWQWYDHVCPRQLVYKETQWIQCYTHTLRDFLLSSSGWSLPLAVVRPRLPSPTSVQGDAVNTMLHTHTQRFLTLIIWLESSSGSGTTTSALAN